MYIQVKHHLLVYTTDSGGYIVPGADYHCHSPRTRWERVNMTIIISNAITSVYQIHLSLTRNKRSTVNKIQAGYMYIIMYYIFVNFILIHSKLSYIFC